MVAVAAGVVTVDHQRIVASSMDDEWEIMVVVVITVDQTKVAASMESSFE
jgi:hypothetical protein